MRVLSLLSVVAVSMVLTSAVQSQAKLKVGDKAPSLKVAKWVKGTPVKQFEKGKVYVVEFWATWCGPCRTSIPHLTELAKKYKGKVTFVGVSIWETQPGSKDTAYMKTVASFVKDMGSKMAYNVAVDGVTGTMAKTWMEAAGENGIPSAFVIDKNGKVAWIGHPMADLDEVLAKVVAGKFNVAAYAKEREKARSEEEKMQALFDPIVDLMEQGKDKEALDALNKVLAKNPNYESQLSMFKYNLMLRVDESSAFDFAKKLAEGQYKDNSMALNQLAWSIVDDEMKLENPDYDVALSIAQRAAELSKFEDAFILDTLAYAHFKKGNIDEAIEYQEKAVAQLEKMDNVPAATQKEIRDRLKMFKEKKSG